jgi:hypothetical protein
MQLIHGIFNYLPLLEMALLEMVLLGLLLRFCHRILSGATHLRLLVTWQATSPIQRGIGRGNDPRALPFPLLSRVGRSSGSSLSYGPPWAHYLGGYQDRLLSGPLGLPGLSYTTPDGVEHKDYGGEVLG